MNKNLCGMILSAAFTATGAGAATLDFVAEAAGNERGVANGTVINFEGLPVTFSSSHFAYFDDLSSGRPAGLGVCKNLNGADQCNPSSDDNVTMGEWVTLSFGQLVDFNVTGFRDADHFDLALSLDTLLIGTDVTPDTSFSFASALGTTFSGITSITFTHGGTSARQFYVSGATATPSEVPLPAAGLLLMGAVGTLALARRRKSAV